MILTVRQQTLQFFSLAFPVGSWVLRKDLRDTAPADVPDQDAFLIIRGRAGFAVEPVHQLDRREVVATLLLERAFADSILSADAVVDRA